MTTFEIFSNVINGGRFVLADLEGKINTAWAEGKLSDTERNELLSAADNGAEDKYQIDVPAKLADLENRVSALESKGIVVWKSGMVTAKGQTVLYDIDKDGVLDVVRYDGGRSSTALSPGKINGWVKVDGNGNPTHTISKDADGKIVLTPIETTEETEITE